MMRRQSITLLLALGGLITGYSQIITRDLICSLRHNPPSKASNIGVLQMGKVNRTCLLGCFTRCSSVTSTPPLQSNISVAAIAYQGRTKPQESPKFLSDSSMSAMGQTRQVALHVAYGIVVNISVSKSSALFPAE